MQSGTNDSDFGGKYCIANIASKFKETNDGEATCDIPRNKQEDEGGCR
jgi:hypothetical protein